MGNPASYFVVEVVSGGSFEEYPDWWLGDTVSSSTECGTYKVTFFFFYESTLSYLNNKQMRCVVRNTEAFIGEVLPVSDAKLIRVISRKYFTYLISDYMSQI